MSEETKETEAATPWKDAGFDSFDDMKGKLDSLQKQFDDTKSKLGSQGDELGKTKQERDDLATQIKEVAPLLKQVIENKDLLTQQAATPKETKEEKRDWSQEKIKLRAKLTDEQKQVAFKAAEEMSDEQKKLLDTDEGQVLFLQEHVLNGGEKAGEAGAKNPLAFLNTEPATDLQSRIKGMFAQAREDRVSKLPVGGSAQAGNATASGGSSSAHVGSTSSESQTYTPNGLLDKLGSALQGS